MKHIEFRIPRDMFEELHRHMFPGDQGWSMAPCSRPASSAAREVPAFWRAISSSLARSIDYVPGQHGHRALSADFVARMSNFCSQQKLAYFAVHNHGGRDSVQFSPVDLESHQRGYPALLDILEGGPVGALVFAENAVAGDIWTPSGVFPLSSLTVVGLNHERLYPVRKRSAFIPDASFDRQSLLFGARGQEILQGIKVGIIGMGGVGSLVNEWLARLGVGEIVVIDYDRADVSNNSRLIGATRWDAIAFLLQAKHAFWRALGERLRRLKVFIGRRVAKTANPKIRYVPIAGDIADESVALQLKDCDFIFLCADSMQSRLVFNALVHQYLIPGVQIGAKVTVEEKTGDLLDVFCVSRPVYPGKDGGCLWCNQLISPAKLQEEAVSAEQRKRQAYVEDPLVHAPAVITLNALAASQAVNEFLFSMVGLHDEEGNPTRLSPGFPAVATLVEGGLYLLANLHALRAGQDFGVREGRRRAAPPAGPCRKPTRPVDFTLQIPHEHGFT